MTLKTYATANAPFSAKKSPSRIPHSTIMVESGERTGDVRQGRAKPADLLVTAFTGATGGGARGQKSHPGIGVRRPPIISTALHISPIQ